MSDGIRASTYLDNLSAVSYAFVVTDVIFSFLSQMGILVVADFNDFTPHFYHDGVAVFTLLSPQLRGLLLGLVINIYQPFTC